VAEGLPTRTVFLTASMSDHHVCEAVSAGVHGLVLKDGACDTLLQCLKEVTAGRRWLPQEIVKPAADRRSERQNAGRVMLSELTKRELEVVQLVGLGLANRAIAETLGLSEGTVKVHLHRIYQKLGIVNRASLAALAATYRADTA
jgi:DNA-binding NarL/FixJ family response regulator